MQRHKDATDMNLCYTGKHNSEAKLRYEVLSKLDVVKYVLPNNFKVYIAKFYGQHYN